MALTKNNRLVVVENTIKNTSVNVISIIEDKLENILNKHFAKLKRANDWVGAAAFFATVLATLLTSDFHKTLGFEPAVFQAIFIILLIVSFGYLCYTIVNAIVNRVSVKKIIKDIKNETA